MLGHDHLRDAPVRRVRVVVLIPVNHQHQVGVLLDRARFPQVGEHRPFVGAGLHPPAELGEGNHRHVQFPGHLLEAPGDAGQLLHAVIGATPLHQLQVVDHHQPQLLAAFGHEPPAQGAHFQHAGVGFVVDEDRHLAEGADALPQQRPLLRVEAPGAQPAALDAYLHGQQAVGELLLAHLQGEHAHRQVVELGHVFGQVERDRRFAHGGPAGHDDQVAALQALGHGVQVVEVHRDAGHRRTQGAALDLVEGGGENFSGGGEAGAGLLLADGEDPLLRLIQHLLHGLALIEAEADHLVAGADQLPPQILVHHQAGHLVDGGGGQSPLHQLHQPPAAPHLLQVAGVRQPGGHGGEVGGFALAVQHQGRAIDLAVGREIKGLRLQHVGHASDGIRVQQDAAQHGFLRLQVLGGHPIGGGFETQAIGAAAAPHGAALPLSLPRP